jgi:RNA polymerase sigma factor (TIGR02999 family)
MIGSMPGQNGDVTQLLLDWSLGDESARERLMPVVFDELRRIARRHLQRERREHTLQPTALVNELYLKLIDRRRVQWKNRAQFFGVAAEMMRQILVDYARARLTKKRGEGMAPSSLDDFWAVAERQDEELLALDAALKDLAELDARQAKVVELRFFAGLNNEAIGEVVGISASTVKREWRTARLWLRRQIARS